ncbi:FkbM family methyltransferase [Winogradskyella maritima]|uniref:FkbM family methyltransferase n=1 Tax=Winogradskyella maritima TaxID=1517766 RepID=A0ABV8AGU1_9FLAO|nr:FkbM family methyltransferase [Winogradskyella maritima]
MNKLWVYIYGKIPKSIRHRLVKQKLFTGLRRYILKPKGSFRVASAKLKKNYDAYTMEFEYVASIKDVARAQQTGIENKILNQSIALLKKEYKDASHFTILDVGANFGYLSLVWAQSICANDGMVYAFEPNLEVFQCLKKSIKANGLSERLKVVNKAVGNQNATVDIYVENATSNMMQDAKMIESHNSITIDMTTIDDFVKHNPIDECHLIKIDVDGIELDILKGAEQTITELRPILIVETNGMQGIYDYLKTLNYRLYDLDMAIVQEHQALPENIIACPIDHKL